MSPLTLSILGSDLEENKRITLQRPVFNSNGLPSAVETDEQRESYEKQADDMTDELWRLYQDQDGWADETRSQDGKDTVTSKTFPNRGKVFRLTVSLTIVELVRFDRPEICLEHRDRISRRDYSDTIRASGRYAEMDGSRE